MHQKPMRADLEHGGEPAAASSPRHGPAPGFLACARVRLRALAMAAVAALAWLDASLDIAVSCQVPLE